MYTDHNWSFYLFNDKCVCNVTERVVEYDIEDEILWNLTRETFFEIDVFQSNSYLEEYVKSFLWRCQICY